MSELKVSPLQSIRQVSRAILAWMFAPPRWVRETQAAIDAFNADHRRRIAQYDEDLAAMKRPAPEQATHPFDEEVR